MLSESGPSVVRTDKGWLVVLIKELLLLDVLLSNDVVEVGEEAAKLVLLLLVVVSTSIVVGNVLSIVVVGKVVVVALFCSSIALGVFSTYASCSSWPGPSIIQLICAGFILTLLGFSVVSSLSPSPVTLLFVSGVVTSCG